MRAARRLFALVGLGLVLLGGLGLALPDPASAWGQVMTPSRPVNLRADRSAKSAKRGTLEPGDKVRVDLGEDGWVAVFDLDAPAADPAQARGYCMLKFLEPAGEGGFGRLLAVDSPMLNVRAGRSPKAEHRKTLYQGDVVRVDFVEDNWGAVFEPGEARRDESRAMGYANVKFLKSPTSAQLRAAMQPSAPAASAAPAKAPAVTAQPPSSGEWGRVATLERPVPVREAPNFPARLVATLKPGDAVRLDGPVDGWYTVYLPQEIVRRPERALGYAWADAVDSGPAASGPAASSPAASSPAASSLAASAVPASPAPVPPVSPAASSPVASAPAASSPVAETGAGEPYVVVGKVGGGAPEPSAPAPDTAPAPGPEPTVKAAPAPAPAESPKTASKTAPKTAPKAVPAAAPEVIRETAPAEPSLHAAPPESASPAAPRPEHVLTVPAAPGPESARGPVPEADQEIHGYRYAVVDREGGESLSKTLQVDVYLDVTRLPSADDLADFAISVWQRERKDGKQTVLNIFLPGQDLKGLSYVKARFDGGGLVEFWARETTLFGTRFR
ncbi:MAG: hypothetical protein AB7D57_09745 [Desulfovibrionaceae bacterium]